MKLATSLAVLVVSAAGAYASSASAQVAEGVHSSASNPASRCQGALPAFETALRKRALAVQNEGTSASFVTCSFEVDGAAADFGIEVLDTYFTNTGTADANVTCTAVSGFAGGTNEYVNKTVSVPAGGTVQGNLFWESADFTNGLFEGLVSISCGLEPGVGVNDTYALWREAPPAT